jgi:hypothetical protein
MVELTAHHLRPAERSTQRGLADDEPAERRFLAVEYLLARKPGGNVTLKRISGDARLACADDRPDVRLGLQQASNEPLIPAGLPAAAGTRNR